MNFGRACLLLHRIVLALLLVGPSCFCRLVLNKGHCQLRPNTTKLILCVLQDFMRAQLSRALYWKESPHNAIEVLFSAHCALEDTAHS